MFWNREKQQIDEPSAGIFSTDFIPAPNRKQKIKNFMQVVHRNFVVPNFTARDASGNVVAMDSGNDTSMQLTKLKNNFNYDVPEGQFLWYGSQGFIGWQTAALFSQQWLVNKACLLPAKDASRHGYELTFNNGTDVSPDVIEKIRERDEDFDVSNNLVEFVYMGRIFGIRVCMYQVDSQDKEYYTKPFNIDGVRPGSYQGMSQIDPYWISPELDGESSANPGNQHFYVPTYWRINGVRVHRSHLKIYIQCQLPDILKPAYLYGGIPIPQMIAERVYCAERTANEAPLLAMTKRLTVLNTDLTQAVANQQAFWDRMQAWSALMNNFGIKAVGGKEKIEQFDTSLADLDNTIMTQFQLVAAASGVPSTKLLGTSPKGFSATGEYDERSYHEELESLQKHALGPMLRRHHELLIKSEFDGKYKVRAKWNPTNALTAEQQADVNLKKSQTAKNYSDIGAIEGFDVRDSLIADPNSGFNGLEPMSRDEMQAAEEAAQENDVDEAAN